MSSGPEQTVSGYLPAALPQELADFLSAGGRSLMVKGGAGTGKTTLSLALISALGATKNFLYLSTRESPSLFVRDHPWLGRIQETGRKTPKRPEEQSSGGFVDARLDEPTQLFERVTSQLMDATSPLIVIDTLDAMYDYTGSKVLKTNVKVLQTWCERAGARLVVTMEDPESTVLDSLMDGVVVLRQRIMESRRLRQIELVKLLGSRIARPSYYFTLNGGRFRTFSEPAQDAFVIPVRRSQTATPGRTRNDPGFLSTGHTQLDAALGGGLPAGAVSSLVLGEGVDPRIAAILLADMAAASPQEGRVLVGPTGDDEESFFDSYMKLLPEAVRSRLEHLDGGHGVKSAGPVLAIVEAANEEAVAKCAAAARSTRGATVVLAREADRRPSLASRLAVSRMKLYYLAGTIMLAAESPFSQFLGVDVVNPNGVPILDMEPIV